MPRFAGILIPVLAFCCPLAGWPAQDETGTSRVPLDRHSVPPAVSARSGDRLRPAVQLPGASAADAQQAWTAQRPPRVGASVASLRPTGAIPIPPAKDRGAGAQKPAGETAPAGRGRVANVVLSSLAIVLGLFFLVVWLIRRAFPKATSSLSTEVLEVLGRTPMTPRHHLQLLRLGKRLLLVSVSSDGAETLAEVTDVDEVNHLIGLCRESQPGSIAGTFRQVLHQMGTQPESRRASRRGAIDNAFPASQPRADS